MPVNVLDPHYLSFVEQVLPVAVEKEIGVIAMKTLAGTPGVIPATGVATVSECLRFAMSLPVSTVCSGMDSLDKLRQNVSIAREFAPLDDEERLALLVRPRSRDGRVSVHPTRRGIRSPLRLPDEIQGFFSPQEETPGADYLGSPIQFGAAGLGLFFGVAIELQLVGRRWREGREVV